MSNNNIIHNQYTDDYFPKLSYKMKCVIVNSMSKMPRDRAVEFPKHPLNFKDSLDEWKKDPVTKKKVYTDTDFANAVLTIGGLMISEEIIRKIKSPKAPHSYEYYQEAFTKVFESRGIDFDHTFNSNKDFLEAMSEASRELSFQPMYSQISEENRKIINGLIMDLWVIENYPEVYDEDYSAEDLL